METHPTFEQLVETVASSVEKITYLHFRTATRTTGEWFEYKDVRHLLRTAVFDAFIKLNGTPEKYLEFEWRELYPELLRLSALSLRNELTGKNSVYDGVTLRMKPRKPIDMLDNYRWDAWEEEQTSTIMDRSATETRLGQLRSALQSVLTPREYAWLTERFIEGKSQYDQIDELCKADTRYQDETGRARAENLINVTILRARRKAARLLDASWAELAREVAA